MCFYLSVCLCVHDGLRIFVRACANETKREITALILTSSKFEDILVNIGINIGIDIGIDIGINIGIIKGKSWLLPLLLLLPLLALILKEIYRNV